ncbi:restriction endonuclease [Pseudomonas plecoglossicida]|uniref:restriction endonuclease n=1 Tax=Pseudomonas plecoglossicida TaxID=70775 RepID=UPI0015E291F3|nr:restriction endonuclease [Pseudomonas plecoglossicida]MBA1196917.1 restriction endonuclease [Pseudomonas plecoglossicida]
MFKELFSWALKNGWNLFSVVGVIGTFYFAIVYVPDYVKDISDSKISLARESLTADLQEIIFYDKKIDYSDVKSLIKGREIKLGFKYPYSAKDLLLEVQDRFVSNKFIPLDRRQELVATIDSMVSSAPADAVPPKSGIDWSMMMAYVISALGVVIALLGWKSLSNKLQADREITVDISGGEVFLGEASTSPVIEALKYEALIAEILKDLGISFTQNASPDSGRDFILPDETPPLQIEVKAYRQLLGLGSAREICSALTRSGWNGILVVSSGLTKNAALYIEQFNRTRDEKVHVITGRDKDQIKEQLVNILRP